MFDVEFKTFLKECCLNKKMNFCLLSEQKDEFFIAFLLRILAQTHISSVPEPYDSQRHH